MGIALAGQGDLAGRSASDAAQSADAATQRLVESLDSLFGGEIDWAGVHAGVEAGVLAAEATPVPVGASVTGSGVAERPSAAMLAVGLALSALWSESTRADEDSRQPRTLVRRRKG